MNLIKNCVLIMGVLFLASPISYCQQPNDAEKMDLPALISKMMEIQKNHDKNPDEIVAPITLTDERIKLESPEKVLSLLKKYERDNSPLVKHFALYYQVRVAKIHPKPEIRQEVVGSLVQELTDPNSHERQQSYAWLSGFKAEDFNSPAKSIIQQSLNKNIHQRNMVLVAGIANITEEIPRLGKLLNDESTYQVKVGKMPSGSKWYYTLGWYARLARARMGVKEDIERCITLIDGEIDLNHNHSLLAHLGYIRQPAAIESLKKYFLSDLRLPPTNPGMLGQPYANFIMNILADNLDNFPVKKKPGYNYTPEEMQTCIEWMKKQTKWQIIR